MKLIKSKNNLPFILIGIKVHGVVRLHDDKIFLHDIEAPNNDEMFFHITLRTDSNHWSRYDISSSIYQIITNLEDYYPVVVNTSYNVKRYSIADDSGELWITPEIEENVQSAINKWLETDRK